MFSRTFQYNFNGSFKLIFIWRENPFRRSLYICIKTADMFSVCIFHSVKWRGCSVIHVHSQWTWCNSSNRSFGPWTRKLCSFDFARRHPGYYHSPWITVKRIWKAGELNSLDGNPRVIFRYIPHSQRALQHSIFVKDHCVWLIQKGISILLLCIKYTFSWKHFIHAVALRTYKFKTAAVPCRYSRSLFSLAKRNGFAKYEWWYTEKNGLIT